MSPPVPKVRRWLDRLFWRRPPAPFDEAFYLGNNPDVARAVEIGRFQSGFEHYMMHGRREGRRIHDQDDLPPRHADEFEPIELPTVDQIAIRIAPLAYAIDPTTTKHVNVVIPTLDMSYFFGGYTAFINFLMRLAPRVAPLRFIVTESAGMREADFLRFRDDPRWGGAFEKATFINATLRDVTLRVHPKDDFFTYSCWTTLDIAPVARALGRRLVFFIQEFEPTFHTTDSLQFFTLMAYQQPHYAIFNSETLKNYFARHQIGVFSGAGGGGFSTFEHAISAKSLSRQMSQRPSLLFYARPEAHARRNLFAVGVLALREAARRQIITERWQLLGIGAREAHSVAISGRLKLRIIPKQSLEQYHAIVSQQTIGLSLMAAPHPGVVHFEWARAGLPTVVNTTPERSKAYFEERCPFLIPAEPSIEGLADAMAVAIERSRELAGTPSRLEAPGHWDDIFTPDWISSFLHDFSRVRALPASPGPVPAS